MMDQFHASRGFVLEVMVVIILVIELVFLFRGK
jgi:competence protein ComGC